MAGSDARRFGFCVRCLKHPDADNILTEHHTEGRASHKNQVVFICNRCHGEIHKIESQEKIAYDRENNAMLAKTRMLVSSRSLQFVIEHRDRVAEGFATKNRNGPGINVGPSGFEFTGPFGGVGITGKRYYFVPISNDSNDKDVVDVYDAPDGIGGVGKAGDATGGWVRFRGKGGGILGSFIDAHRGHANVAERLDAIEQN